jgi:hypothetical protein
MPIGRLAQVDYLAPARDQVSGRADLRIRYRSDLWPNPRSKQGNDLGHDHDRLRSTRSSTARVRGTPAWRETEDLLASVPGLVPITARTPIPSCPSWPCSIEAGSQLWPVNRDSGAMRGWRVIMRGRTTVRNALLLATIGATPWNPIIRA